MSDQGVKYKITADVEQAGKDIDNFSKRSRVALTNLTQVVQDLPYGFIGIQNNLPYLVSSFNELTKEVGGADKAIVSLINQLRGTVGLVFAFSAVTSVVTFLIQEFGSLGNAYDALISKTTAAATATREYNKALDEQSASAQGEKVILQALFEVLGNVNQSYDKRVQAFQKIEKLNGGHIKGIEDEKKALNLTNDELDRYLKLFEQQQNLVSKGQALQAALSTVYKKFYEDLDKLNDQDILFGLKQIAKGFKQGEFNPMLAFLSGAKTTTQEWKNAINELSVALKNNEKDLLNVNNQLGAGSGFKTTKDDVKNLSTQVEDLRGKWSLDTQITELQKLRTTLLDVSYIEKNGQKITKGFVATELERKDALTKLQQLYPEMFKNMNTQMSNYETLDDLTFTLIRGLQNQRDEILANGKAISLQTQADKNTNAAKEEQIKINEDLLKSLINLSMGNEQFYRTLKDGMFDVESWVTALEQTKEITDEYYNLLDEMANETKQTYNEIQSFVSQMLTRPLNYLVNQILEKGKVTWKEFADMAIESLKRIAAQVAINAIIGAIASAISPQAGLMDILQKSKTKDLKGFLDFTNYLDFLGPGSANFGGVQGGLGITGQVVFVQRGSDLVGVLNRTNTNIGRIG